MSLATTRVVYQLPSEDAITVRTDLASQTVGGDALTMDVYYPPHFESGMRLPAVVIVAGYPDPGFQKHLGCRFKDMASSTSWARLIAASGIVAITYTNVQPAEDLGALLGHLRANAGIMGLDDSSIGVWASSGNAALAMSLVMNDSPVRIRCAALCYPFTLDTDGAGTVAEASKAFGFVNPCAGKTVDDVSSDVALFIARAGQDEVPHLNETLDRFVAKALRRNLPITVTNHPGGPHAFDLLHDSDLSRAIVRQILAFLRFHLLESSPAFPVPVPAPAPVPGF
jgi:dienelactone hydrolase